MTFKTKNNKSAAVIYQESIAKSLKALGNNKHDLAKEMARKAIKINPESALGYEVLARAYEYSGDPLQAYQIITKNLVRKHDQHYDLYAGELAARNGHYADAIALLNTIPENTPEYIAALKWLVYCHSLLNDYINKYLTLKKLKDITTLSLEQVYLFADAIQHINVNNGIDIVLADIDELLGNPQFDTRLLTTKTSQFLLQYLPELNSPETIALDNRLLRTPLLWSIVSKTCITNIKIDLFLMYTRKNLLLHLLQKGEIEDNFLAVCKSLAAQNFLNEYIHYIDSSEKEIIQGLLEAIAISLQDSHWQPADSEAIFHILLMYMPLRATAFSDQLTQYPLLSWPKSLQFLAEKTLFLPLLEIAIGRQTPQLTKISTETPQLVNSHYEENPYPRWQGTYCNPSHTLAHYIHHLHPDLPLGKDFFKPVMSILIAGCGTGKQAIDAALLYPNSKITAFDISFRSLGYAQLKAQEYGISNVEFFHGDILELGEDLGLFDYIECCGVLHHLKNPMAGWKILTERLKPNGVMRVDLYSKYARQQISERRKQILQLAIGTSLDELRLFRHAMIAQSTDDIFSIFSDFYNTSEFRDLLFHNQETQYSLPEIEQALNQLDLQFIALFVAQEKQSVFRQEYPNGNIHDLALWHQVEVKNPQIFASMYAFWCQKKTQNSQP